LGEVLSRGAAVLVGDAGGSGRVAEALTTSRKRLAPQGPEEAAELTAADAVAAAGGDSARAPALSADSAPAPSAALLPAASSEEACVRRKRERESERARERMGRVSARSGRRGSERAAAVGPWGRGAYRREGQTV